MRLIDADALAFTHDYVTANGEPCITKAVIDNAPTIDAVSIVRCKDCKHFRTFRTSSDDEEIRTCVGKGIVDLNYDDFCSKGERKDDD